MGSVRDELVLQTNQLPQLGVFLKRRKTPVMTCHDSAVPSPIRFIFLEIKLAELLKI